MRFISVRELRSAGADISRRLADEGELVLTSNGKPIALLSPADETSLSRQLEVLRTAKAMLALDAIHQRSAELGNDQITAREIEDEIAAARRERAEMSP